MRVCLLRIILSHHPARSIRGRDEIGFIESYDSIWQKSSMTERDKRVTIKVRYRPRHLHDSDRPWRNHQPFLFGLTENAERTMIRVLVVEDHAQTRAGIRDYLLSQGMEVNEASNTADALKLLEKWKPQVVVLDIVIPPRHGEKANLHHGDGIRAAQLIKAYDAEIGIVLLSNHPYYRPEVLDLAGQGYGGLVYLFKGESPANELRNAIQQALEGRLVFDPQVSRSGGRRANDTSRSLTEQEREIVEYAVSQMAELTEREWQVVELVAAARTNAGIAKGLHIAPSSVQTHLSNIYGKAGLGDSEAGALLDKRALLAKAYMVYRSKRVRGRG